MKTLKRWVAEFRSFPRPYKFMIGCFAFSALCHIAALVLRLLGD